jgi:hypothetical protein
MKWFGVGGDRSLFFAPINLYRSRFAQLDRNDTLRRIGTEKELVFVESHSGTTTSARANQGRHSTHAAVAHPLDFCNLPGLHLRFEAPMPDPGAGIFPQDRVVAWRQRNAEAAFRIGGE